MATSADDSLAHLYRASEGWAEWLDEHVSALFGLPPDQALFLLSQIVSLPLGLFLRLALPVERVGETVRHFYCLFFGILFTIVCFRWQIFNVLIPSIVLYIVLHVYGRSARLGSGVLFASMLYLSANHIYRQYTDYGGYTLDITGPLMIITQKMSSLAWSCYDGQKPDSEISNEEHRKNKVSRVPGPLEFFSYLLGFMGFQTGPSYFYQDYMSFIQGRNSPSFKTTNAKGEEVILTPSHNLNFFKTLAKAIVCGIVVDRICPLYSVGHLADEHFIRDTSFVYKLWYCYIATTIYRFRYYFAWKLGEAICIAAGFGFTEWTPEGEEKWDLVKNCEIFNIESATSMKVVFDKWNMQTAKWLRFICYSRMADKNKATKAVFLLSAFWHGFYPGYYTCFGLGMLYVSVSRRIRRLVRPQFQSSKSMSLLYDVITYIATHLALSFAVTSQILMRLSLVFKVYRSLYFYLPIAAIVLKYMPIPFVPSPDKKKEKAKTGGSQSHEDNTNSTNNVSPAGDDNQLRQRAQESRVD